MNTDESVLLRFISWWRTSDTHVIAKQWFLQQKWSEREESSRSLGRKSSMNKSGSAWPHKSGIILWCQQWNISGRFFNGFHGVSTSMHIIPHPPHFHQKKMKCHDMISASHKHHSTTWIGGLMWWSNLRNGGFWWLDALLAWHTVS